MDFDFRVHGAIRFWPAEFAESGRDDKSTKTWKQNDGTNKQQRLAACFLAMLPQL